MGVNQVIDREAVPKAFDCCRFAKDTTRQHLMACHGVARFDVCVCSVETCVLTAPDPCSTAFHHPSHTSRNSRTKMIAMTARLRAVVSVSVMDWMLRDW
jgi:hypothetical protein